MFQYLFFFILVLHISLCLIILEKKLSLNCCDSIEELKVSIPSSETIKNKNLAKEVKLMVNDQEMEADVYIIKMNDFDIVLGIDWLSRNHETIRYFEQEINFIDAEE